MKLFEYAILLHPTSEEKKNGVPSKVIVPVTSVLATDQNSAVMLAGRAIPEDQLANVERLEVVVRPF